MSAMHVLQRVPSSVSAAPHSWPGNCHTAALSAAASAAACQRGAASKHRTQQGSHAVARSAERSAPLCRSANVSAADPASAAPAGTDGDTSLGSAGWNQFADAASGEWSGIAVTYDATGEAQELPYQYVPQAFREWGAVPKDWHTQCSTLADCAGLLTKLKRLYPIVGCEADAVAFEEEQRRDFREPSGCEEDAVAFQEESSRSLRSDEQHATEPKTVLPSGSYSTGPRVLTGLTTARFEHCLVSEPGRRARVVFNLKRDDAARPWRLATLEQHVERRTGDYDGGASLEACGYNMVDVTGEPKPEREQLEGPWSITSHTAWRLEDGGEAFRCCSAADADSVPLVDDALLLHGRMWAAVGSAADSGSGTNGSGGSPDGGYGSGSGRSSRLKLEAGLLLGDGRCVAARRAFDGNRLTATAFVAAEQQ